MRANVLARPEQIQSLISTISAAFAAAFERVPEEARMGGMNAFLNVDLEGERGAVLKALRGLSRFDTAIVAAAALPASTQNAARASAIEFLATFAMPASLARRIDAVLARHLIGRHFGGRIDYKELGAIHDLDPSNVRRRACAVSEALAVEERATWQRVASILHSLCGGARFSMEA